MAQAGANEVDGHLRGRYQTEAFVPDTRCTPCALAPPESECELVAFKGWPASSASQRSPLLPARCASRPFLGGPRRLAFLPHLLLPPPPSPFSAGNRFTGPSPWPHSEPRAYPCSGRQPARQGELSVNSSCTFPQWCEGSSEAATRTPIACNIRNVKQHRWRTSASRNSHVNKYFVGRLGGWESGRMGARWGN